jgi:hypothetical protein
MGKYERFFKENQAATEFSSAQEEIDLAVMWFGPLSLHVSPVIGRVGSQFILAKFEPAHS